MALAETGAFILLYDEETLKLYLSQGVYGAHMAPVPAGTRPSAAHFGALADYGCLRKGMQVFFFRKRRIYYAGQVLGSPDHGAFYLNGRQRTLSSQCLDRRIATQEDLEHQVAAWEWAQNQACRGVDWQFTTADAPHQTPKTIPPKSGRDSVLCRREPKAPPPCVAPYWC